ncbi:hypothetical protein D9M72_376830 [compost metagenome]
MEQEVELVDAVAHGGAAALGVPGPPPRHVPVAVRAVPEGVAAGHERAAEAAGPDQGPRGSGRVAETVLEHAGELRAALRLRSLQPVEVGQRQRRRFLGEHVHSRFQALDGLVDVHHGRRAQVHDVRFGHGQQFGKALVAAGNPVLLTEGIQPRRVHIAGRHEFRPVAGPCQVVRVHRGDPTRSHDGHFVRPHLKFSAFAVIHRLSSGLSESFMPASELSDTASGPTQPRPSTVGTSAPQSQ